MTKQNKKDSETPYTGDTGCSVNINEFFEMNSYNKSNLLKEYPGGRIELFKLTPEEIIEHSIHLSVDMLGIVDDLSEYENDTEVENSIFSYKKMLQKQISYNIDVVGHKIDDLMRCVAKELVFSGNKAFNGNKLNKLSNFELEVFKNIVDDSFYSDLYKDIYEVFVEKKKSIPTPNFDDSLDKAKEKEFTKKEYLKRIISDKFERCDFFAFWAWYYLQDNSRAGTFSIGHNFISAEDIANVKIDYKPTSFAQISNQTDTSNFLLEDKINDF